MTTLAIALGSAVLYVVAYHTYGRYLSRRVFGLDPTRIPPAVALNDGVDYVPSSRAMVFGHHFTTIAGTGPIVGPAIAVIWGWVPALIWVLVGSVVMGAVHDLGSLMVSLRHQGRTIADVAGDIVNARVRLLFMLLVLVSVWIVLAVFGLVVAVIFHEFPQAVWPSFIQTLIALALGVYLRRGGNMVAGSIVAVALMYASVALASAWEPMQFRVPAAITAVMSPNVFWTLALLAYVFVASVLPVHWLLQPRDYINALQLILGMALLLAGVVVTAPPVVADAVNLNPRGAPPLWPFLFVTVACGAISGFHSLAASGCASRQLRSERDAPAVGFGAMLLEGFLAVLVILACVAGFGLGIDGSGPAAWRQYYTQWKEGLSFALVPVVTGSANMIEQVGIPGTSLAVPHSFAAGLVGVFIASFATTTMDSAARLQRYVIAEMAARARVPMLESRYVASAVAVVSAGALALADVWERGWQAGGAGGMILWPIFGATNQLLAGLALLVVTVWLLRGGRPIWATCGPMVFMLLMTGWAIAELIRTFSAQAGRVHLAIVAGLVLVLEIWIVAETVLLILRRGTTGTCQFGRSAPAPEES